MSETLGAQIRRLRDQIGAEAVRLRREGKSLRAIGDELGISHPRVLEHLRAAGVADTEATTAADRRDAPSMDAFMRDRMPGATTDDRTPATADEWMRQRAGTLEPTDDPNGTDA